MQPTQQPAGRQAGGKQAVTYTPALAFHSCASAAFLIAIARAVISAASVTLP